MLKPDCCINSSDKLKYKTFTLNEIRASKEVKILTCVYHFRGPGQLSRYSDSLHAGRSGDQIPVEARFSAPIQTAPETHPVSCTMGIRSFPGVKPPGRGVGLPSSSSTEVKERVELYLFAFMACYRVIFTFTFICTISCVIMCSEVDSASESEYRGFLLG